MKQHKWHKEIKAWADGAEIEAKWWKDKSWFVDDNPDWSEENIEYRIKPQPKEPQYLYAYHGKKSDGEMGVWFEQQRVPYIENGYIGKIKLEVDDD